MNGNIGHSWEVVDQCKMQVIVLLCALTIMVVGMTEELAAGPDGDLCGTVEPVCGKGSCMCNNTFEPDCQFVRGTINGSCSKCCRGHHFDNGMCVPCVACDEGNDVQSTECAKDGTSRKCINYDAEPTDPENCEDITPRPSEIDECPNKPICDERGFCLCNGSKNGCNYVRGSGEHKICAKCCEEYFYDEGYCVPCGKCPAEGPVTMPVCQLDASGKDCRTDGDVNTVDPNTCPGPQQSNKVLIITACSVIGAVLIICLCIYCWRRCRRRPPQRYTSQETKTYINGQFDPSYSDRYREVDEGGMTDVKGHAWDEEEPNREPYAPGYDEINSSSEITKQVLY